MATHSSTLTWKIPWTEEPGRLQSMESRRVRHDWVTSLSLFTFMHWRWKWQPTPVFLAWRIPGTEEPGRGSHRVGHDWSDLAAAYYKNFKTIYSKFFLLILCAFVVMQTYNTFIHVKVMANLDSILKSRDITLLTKVRLVKAMVFPVVMYGCESWTIKKAEHRRIDAFELWCWRRLLRVLWTARRSNQSILKEISPGCSL